MCFQVSAWKENFLFPHTILAVGWDTGITQLDYFSYRQKKTPPSPRYLGAELRSSGESQAATRGRQGAIIPWGPMLGKLETKSCSAPPCEEGRICKSWRDAVTQGRASRGRHVQCTWKCGLGRSFSPGSQSQPKATEKWLLMLLSRCSRIRLCATPQTAAHQAPPSLGFSRQEHWSGLPFPSPMHESESEVAQSCPTLSDLMDCSLPGSSIHGIFQARVLEWGAIAFSNDCNGSLLKML